jgi:acetyl-CoA C-acetyltransferase
MGAPDLAIVGIGIHPFGRHERVSGRRQAVVATNRALEDAGIDWSRIGFAAGGSRDGGFPDSLVSELGFTAIPFVNVLNGCATGGAALATAGMALRAGDCDLALALGFDKHPSGAFAPNPANFGVEDWYGETGMMLTTQFFALKTARYMHEHGISERTLARAGRRAFANGALNPLAWRRRALTEDEILASRPVNPPLTQYMFCSPGEGAVAIVLCRAEDAARFPKPPVHLRGLVHRTRRFGTFEVFNSWLPPEPSPSPTVEAARDVFEQAGVGPEDVDVAQLQDTDCGSEVIHMAETGLCADGEQERLLRSGATDLDGELPINTDGGCLANGEPIGASGLRQIHECVVQLRGEAGDRQVPGQPKVAFTHVYGAPGISACTVLSR